jgi:hypothetical protein
LILVEPDKYEEVVDLQSSDILINFDIKFDPLKMEQRIGRIDRVKLGNEQSQLEIISFTPLNDMSGYMVDFLAHELKMFSCWKGDTTGIVTLPLGEKPKSATFEQAILSINAAYISLYQFDYNEFMKSCKSLVDLSKMVFIDQINKIAEIQNREEQVMMDFKYLKDSSQFINDIVYNSDCSNNETGDEGKIIFGELCVLSKKKALMNEEISRESINNHRNDLKLLKKAIENYYKTNITEIKSKLNKMIQSYERARNRAEVIENTFNSKDKETYKMLQNTLKHFEQEYTVYKNSNLFHLPIGSMGIDKDLADLTLLPVLNKFKDTVNTYLDLLTELFDYFCSQVTDKSLKMSRFISYLTIEEFRVMAENYE